MYALNLTFDVKKKLLKVSRTCLPSAAKKSQSSEPLYQAFLKVTRIKTLPYTGVFF